MNERVDAAPVLAHASPRGAAKTARNALIYAAAAVAVLIWGGTAVVTKIAVTAFDPLLVGVSRLKRWRRSGVQAEPI